MPGEHSSDRAGPVQACSRLQLTAATPSITFPALRRLAFAFMLETWMDKGSRRMDSISLQSAESPRHYGSSADIEVCPKAERSGFRESGLCRISSVN